MKKKTLATKIGAALMSAVLAVSMAACGNDGASPKVVRLRNEMKINCMQLLLRLL